VTISARWRFIAWVLYDGRQKRHFDLNQCAELDFAFEGGSENAKVETGFILKLFEPVGLVDT
jgi:hypothetical protein